MAGAEPHVPHDPAQEFVVVGLGVLGIRAQVVVVAHNLDDLFEPITLGSINGRYLELVGPSDTILGTIVESGGLTWFFKLAAPNRLADRSRKDFKSFVHSSRFEAAGGSDGE